MELTTKKNHLSKFDVLPSVTNVPIRQAKRHISVTEEGRRFSLEMGKGVVHPDLRGLNRGGLIVWQSLSKSFFYSLA